MSSNRCLLLVQTLAIISCFLLQWSTTHAKEPQCPELLPEGVLSGPEITWNEFCARSNRHCAETKDNVDIPLCYDCLPGFKEDPFYNGSIWTSCIAITKCNEVKSGKTTWTRDCESLQRACVEPTAEGTAPKCGKCLGKYVESPDDKGDVSKACIDVTCPDISGLKNGRTLQDCKDATASRTCIFSCDNNYVIEGPSSTTCMKSMKGGKDTYEWEPPNKPKCVNGAGPAFFQLGTLLLSLSLVFRLSKF